jgi:hypothetical protein
MLGVLFTQPEGATVTRYTSLLLDLKNRAHVLRYLDIPVEESPIIPYSKFRRYVFGSPRASVTLCGIRISTFSIHLIELNPEIFSYRRRFWTRFPVDAHLDRLVT